MRSSASQQFLRFIFAFNPGQATYGSTSMRLLLIACGSLVVLSFLIGVWRRSLTNSMTRKLSRTWPSVSFWFGIVGLVLVVCRVEQIQFLAMRFFWALWILALLVYIFVQLRLFRARHYEILPRVSYSDPREKYLPGKKKK
ncbi:hypothetical protein HY285_03035 [Candidatus Peregrinibacteria bacterium]|nr:hypothetical protein [Candidatus Peregrinibacteria bacterium]MBI3816491.1 hypothetical protein [Candidatus Peregrinibacteria bacterium]